MSLLIYPNDPDFNRILHSIPPPNWRSEVSGDIAYLAPDSNGILTVLSSEKVDDYLEENNCKMKEPETETIDTFDNLNLWLPY